MVTMVLLKVAVIWATPRVTPLRMRFLTPAFAPVWGLRRRRMFVLMFVPP